MRGRAGGSPDGEYELHRIAVLGMLAKRFPRLDDDERLAIYHDAWARVLAKRGRGEKIVALRAYLMATAGAEALNLLSRGRVPTPLGPDDPRLAALADEAPPPDEQVVVRDQARIARNLLDTLDERQRDVLKLRWDLQLSAAEVRAALGLSERQYRRLAEEGAAAIAERVEELESGRWSRRTRSLLVACLVEVARDDEPRRVGIASRGQRAEAQRLLESDPHVAALFAEVRRSIRGAAALLPLPAFVAAPTSDPLGRLAELASDLRAQIDNAVATAKHHATSLYLRAADPALIASGPRPGATIAVVATAAAALGGGAYGAYEATSTSSPPRIDAPPAVTAPVTRGQSTPRAAHPAGPPGRRAGSTTVASPSLDAPSTQPPPQHQPVEAPPLNSSPPADSIPSPPQRNLPPRSVEFGFEN